MPAAIVAWMLEGRDVTTELEVALIAGLDPNIQLEGEFATLLQAASSMEQHELACKTAAVLLQYGADPNASVATSRWGSPVCDAVGSENHALLALLLMHGADPFDRIDGESLLYLAVDNENPTAVALLLQHGANDFYKISRDGACCTPLSLALARGRLDIVALLLGGGCPPDALDWESTEDDLLRHMGKSGTAKRETARSLLVAHARPASVARKVAMYDFLNDENAVLPENASEAEVALTSALAPDKLLEVDRTLVGCASWEQRKVAVVVSSALNLLEPSLPESEAHLELLVRRVQHLCAEARLEAVGDVRRPRACEVVRPRSR